MLVIVLVEHPESVVIVAADGDSLVAVRQARPGASEPTVELPAGKIEPGETPAEAAARELEEECALVASELRPLGSFWAAPAYSTEYVHVFEARGLTAVAGDPELDVLRVPADGACLTDAVSLAALVLRSRR
jgi:ADP-ribose pyrophosphatase